MVRSSLLLVTLGLGAAATIAVGFTPPTPAHANKVMQTGRVNPGILRFCENQRNDNWVSAHAPRDETFFHQEVVLGEGNYTLRVNSGGRFRFNVFIYDRDTKRYLGGSENVYRYGQRLSSGVHGRAFLVQAVKTSDECRGCSINMSLDAYNCPRKTPSPTRKPCRINQCYDPGAQDLYGLPLRPPRCVSKPGASGGVCGTRGN